jgi:hypothetical protein
MRSKALKHPNVNMENPDDRLITLKMAFIVADLGFTAKKWSLHSFWSDALAQQRFA